MYSYSLQRVRRYTHTRGLAGSDGGSRDLWLPREVTQRLIYFTGVRPPPPLLRPLLSHHQHRGTTSYTPPVSPLLTLPPFFSSGALEVRCIIAEALCALGSEGASSRHCATYTTGQPPLHAATSYLHEKGESASSFSTPFHPPVSSRPQPGAPRSSLQCKHGSSLSPGSLYFKGHGARLFTLVPRHFGHDPPSVVRSSSTHRAIYTWFRGEFFPTRRD